jgi:ketosteroid isomerase-like protein
MGELTDLGPMTAVRAFVKAFNNEDADGAEAACVDDMQIIDDFPPYQWTGGQAVARWFDDMARMAEKYAMSEPSVALKDPLHVIVSDHSAYVVVPIDVRWRENGTRAERAGYMTMKVREGGEGWVLSACAWTWK